MLIRITNDEPEDKWLYFAPQSLPPRTPLSALKHPDSTICACIKRRDIVIIEDTLKESKKQKGRAFLSTNPEDSDDEGSIICYPVIQPVSDNIVYVLSVYVNKKGYFTTKKKALYKKVFEHFALRMRLENSLTQLKHLSQSAGVTV